MATLSHLILVDNTLRYSSDWNSTYDWKTVYKYYQDTGNNRYNVFGKSGGAFNASCIPIPAFAFSGRGKKITLSMYCYYPEAHTFRYALCTSNANRAAYQGTTGAVTDNTQIVQGTFSPVRGSGNNTGVALEITANIPANTALYLYIWAYEVGAYAPHILRDVSYSSGVTVTLEYDSGLAHIGNGEDMGDVYMVHIDNGSAFEPYIPYIHNGVDWEVMA